MQMTISVPQAFSVRDEHEFYPFQHLMSRLHPELRVVQVATGMHVHGGCTVFWGVVYQNGHSPSRDDVEKALQRAGFDLSRNSPIHMAVVKDHTPSASAIA